MNIMSWLMSKQKQKKIQLAAMVPTPRAEGGAAMQRAMSEVLTELIRASEKYPALRSSHEGYAVLLEELDEVWDEVKKKQTSQSKSLLRSEARQVAAMAVRFMIDLTEES